MNATTTRNQWFDTATGLPVNRCTYCGKFCHDALCPRIVEIEYYENGALKRVRLRDSGE